MKESNAEQTTSEEMPANTESIFDDSQPMTYQDVDQDEDPTQGSQTIVTNYDDDDAGQRADGDNLPDSVKAYRELQSKADRDAQALKQLREEQEAYKAQLDDFNVYKPVIRYLEENPQIIDQLATMGKEPVQQKQVAKVEEELTAPQRPSDYDKFAAYNDPDSESFKYREQMDEYRLRKIESVEANIELKRKEYEDMINQKEQETRQRLAEQELHRVLARDFQMSEQERRDFVEFSRNPSPSLDVLVDVFRSVNPKTVQEPKAEQPPAKNFKSIVNAPGSSDPTAQIDEHQTFTSGLATKKRNLFDTV